MENMDFYNKVARRPLINVVPDPGEAEAASKAMSNSNDITLYSWRNDWIANTKSNFEHFGYFDRDHSVKIFFNELIQEACILVGAGPSLQNNIQKLVLAKEKGIKIICSHHAYMYLSKEEVNVKPDYVVMLDAGSMWEEYTKTGMDNSDIPLLAEQTCNTEQIKLWKGPTYFFKSIYPDSTIGKFINMELDRIVKPTKCSSTVQVGGHAMGAMLAIARTIMQSPLIIFCGADYCFQPETEGGKFYPFDHKIDQEVDGKYFGSEGQMLPSAPPKQGLILDIFGNMVYANGAYLQFKNIMDYAIRDLILPCIANQQEIEMVNASEGGALGALRYGNSKYMRYMTLEDAIYMAEFKINMLREQSAPK